MCVCVCDFLRFLEQKEFEKFGSERNESSSRVRFKIFEDEILFRPKANDDDEFDWIFDV